MKQICTADSAINKYANARSLKPWSLVYTYTCVILQRYINLRIIIIICYCGRLLNALRTIKQRSCRRATGARVVRRWRPNVYPAVVDGPFLCAHTHTCLHQRFSDSYPVRGHVMWNESNSDYVTLWGGTVFLREREILFSFDGRFPSNIFFAHIYYLKYCCELRVCFHSRFKDNFHRESQNMFLGLNIAKQLQTDKYHVEISRRIFVLQKCRKTVWQMNDYVKKSTTKLINYEEKKIITISML